MLTWMKSKIKPSQLDGIISAGIPNSDVDPVLNENIKKHMIHGPCGKYNPKSPCMKNNKCTKKYLRVLVQETQTGGDGYPLYRRGKPEDGGNSLVIKVKGVDVVIDNRWVIPHCLLLSKIFDAHINVEYCQSIKSIKYVLKYDNVNLKHHIIAYGSFHFTQFHIIKQFKVTNLCDLN